jgi:hypothetical protein
LNSMSVRGVSVVVMSLQSGVAVEGRRA